MNGLILGLMALGLAGFGYGQRASDLFEPPSEPIAPKWHAEVSKTDARSVTVTVDLKSLSRLKYVKNLRFKVELLDKRGRVQATKEIFYTDLSLPALKGGGVYKKEFKMADARGAISVRGVSMSGNVVSQVYVYQEPQRDPAKGKV